MVQTVCMPAKSAALCRNLTKDQRRIVETTGLGSLLNIPSMPIQRMLLERLVESYNENSRTFTIRGHVLSISTWDVYCILGLVDKEEKIEVGRKQADRKWFNLYKQEGETAITFSHLKERIPKETDPDHFARMFVLYAIGTVLAPTSKGYVGSNYLELVIDVSRIKGLNWAQFTLEHLLENLSSFKMNRRTGLAANLALFQVWFFEHFQTDGDCFDYAFHEHPLIKNWNETKVLKRACLEGIKKFGAEKVVIELEPHESKVRTDNNNLDPEIDGQYSEGMRYENFETENLNEKVEKEEVNRDGLHDGMKDNEIKMKESMESVKFLLERFPQFHTIVQMLVKVAAGSNTSTKCEGKQSDPSGTSKLGESHFNVRKGSERASSADKMDESEKVKPCPEPGTAAIEREGFSGTSGQSDLYCGIKRKINFVSSPTLVEKVKTRTNRKKSKACKSPYTGTKQKRISKTKTNGASVDEVTVGLKLSSLELAAIAFVREELDKDPRKDIVHIGEGVIMAKQLKCLVRPLNEDGQQKWLGSSIVDAYSAVFNSDWNEDTNRIKHAILEGQSQWLRTVGKSWIKYRKPWYMLCVQFAQEFLGADMVFIPINTTQSHWWLCVLYPSRKEFPVLDSYDRFINYEEETNELRCGIHSILQAIMSSSEKLESRWSNYDILNWNVVVKKKHSTPKRCMLMRNFHNEVYAILERERNNKSILAKGHGDN